VSFVVGLVAAVVASLLFNVGLVLQALEARREKPELGLRLELLVRLVRRWRWLLGLGLGLVGVAPQVVALELAPFVVVQPALTVGLLAVLALGSRTFGERVPSQAWAGVVAIIAGVALVALGAPDHAEAHRGGLAVVWVVGALAAGAFVPFLVRGKRLDTGELAMIASGVGFAATNVATKLFSDDVGLGHRWNAGAWAVVGLALGVAATLTGMTAFQRVEATVVVPVTTVVQTFLPMLLEPLFLRERWDTVTLAGTPVFVGVVLALLGTVAVTRSPAVAGVAAAAGSGAARAGARHRAA
jgi:drug/metabolite transporter (DMT)-like permease